MTRMHVPLVRPCLPSLDEIAPDLQQVLDSGRLTNFGPFSLRLEANAAAYIGVPHAAALSSATTGLSLLLNTLPSGSEVIMPSFTFVATAQAVIWNGQDMRLRPVFADIRPDTLNVSPESVEACITPATSAILAVHAFGVPADAAALESIAARHNVRLFFDSAHAFGSASGGRRTGASGDAEVFSLSATKLVPSGEGGLVTTTNPDVYRAILDRRNYGLTHGGSRDCANPGMNAKLPEFNAILALKEIATMAWRLQRRNEIACRYLEGLSGVPGLRFQHVPVGDTTTWKDFTIQVDPEVFGITRDELRRNLAARGIETAPYFWPAVHQMTYFRRFRQSTDDLRCTEHVTSRILSLPLFETLSTTEVDYVITGVLEARRAGVHTTRRTGAI